MSTSPPPGSASMRARPSSRSSNSTTPRRRGSRRAPTKPARRSPPALPDDAVDVTPFAAGLTNPPAGVIWIGSNLEAQGTISPALAGAFASATPPAQWFRSIVEFHSDIDAAQQNGSRSPRRSGVTFPPPRCSTSRGTSSARPPPLSWSRSPRRTKSPASSPPIPHYSPAPPAPTRAPGMLTTVEAVAQYAWRHAHFRISISTTSRTSPCTSAASGARCQPLLCRADRDAPSMPGRLISK